MNVYGYSERGMINTLVYNMNEETANSFVGKLLNKEDVNETVFYIEHSLSSFGSPDLLITFKENGKLHLVFVEAKVSNGNKWSLQKQYNDYCSNKNITSNLFRQFGLKMLLVNRLDEVQEGIAPNTIKAKQLKEDRTTSFKIGSNPVVNKLCKIIKEAKNNDTISYLAITPDNTKPTFTSGDEQFNTVLYKSWDDIISYTEGSLKQKILETKDWNEELIY